MPRVSVVPHEGGWAVEHEGLDKPISTQDRCGTCDGMAAVRPATAGA